MNFKNSLKSALIILSVYLLHLFSLPLIIAILLPIGVWGVSEEYTSKVKYKEYLRSISGTCFFCYNNRSDSRSYIEESILPRLAPEIKIIFLDGRTPESDFQSGNISKFLYDLKDKRGFPYLLKVKDDCIIDQSINNEFYNTMNQNKYLEQFMERIHSFYDSN